MFRERIRTAITSAIRDLQAEGVLGAFDVPPFSVEAPEQASFGDYATNAAMVLAKAVRKSPMEIAEALAGKLSAASAAFIGRAAVAPPGFVNVTLAPDAIREAAANALARSDSWGRSNAGGGKTVRLDYFQLNIAKRPHVGNLRSAVIGDALKRMFLASGWKAVADTHVGDWGTQFGILLKAYKEHREDREDIEGAGDPFDALEVLYQKEVALIERDSERRAHAKEEFAKLERGDAENRRIWQWMVDVSMKKLDESAKRLGLLPFELHLGESAYEADMPPIVEEALAKGIAVKKDDGAVVADLSAEGLDEAVLTKADGASTYLLRDLATIRRAKRDLGFSKNIYVVDVRQTHHFRQVFRVAGLLGFEGVGESVHVEFGFMTLPEGAMSTRKGTAISLDAVLDEATKRARAVIAEKNPELTNADDVARAVGVGAIKYFDLSHHRKSDIVFRWEEALSFDGNAGPYLQYTYARLKSILRKMVVESIENIKNRESAEFDGLEHRLMVAALRLPEAVEDALAGYAPNVLANYLYHLAQLANEFYHSHPVAQEAVAEKRDIRIALVALVALTMSKGLSLLGIQTPEEM